MMKPVIVFVCALIAGGAAGWRSAGPGREPAVAVAMPGMRASPPMPKWGKEDFISFLRARAAKAEIQRTDSLPDILAEWTLEEIRAALQEGLMIPEASLDSDGGGCSSLFAEWLKRDFDGALSWYASLASPSYQVRLGSTLSDAWPPERCAEGLRFVMENRELFPHTTYWKLVIRNLEAEALKGADALVALLGSLRKNDLDLKFGGPVEFPRGFDFQKLAASDEFRQLGMNTVAGRAVFAWTEQDREAAFAWLLAEKGAGALPALMSRHTGLSTANLEWIGTRLATLPATERADFFQAVEALWIHSPESAFTISRMTRDESVLAEIRSTALQAMFAGEVDQVMPMIEQLPDPAARINLLASLERSEAFQSRPELLGLQEHGEASLRAKLAEWNASDSEIESIIQKFNR